MKNINEDIEKEAKQKLAREQMKSGGVGGRVDMGGVIDGEDLVPQQDRFFMEVKSILKTHVRETFGCLRSTLLVDLKRSKMALDYEESTPQKMLQAFVEQILEHGLEGLFPRSKSWKKRNKKLSQLLQH